MIKVPKYVQEAAMRCAKYNQAALKQEAVIDQWVAKHKGFDYLLSDSYRDLVIDCLHQGQAPKKFARYLEFLMQQEETT